MDLISLITPDELALWAAIAVIIAAFLSAGLTAAFGIGGGLALVAIMSALLPAPAVVPIHGVAQLGSNAGRFYLQRLSVVWPIVAWFAGGCVVGTFAGGQIAVNLPVWALRLGVAIFILATVWGPKPRAFSPGPATYSMTGAVGSFLTMFFGATGPLAATMLSAAELDRLKLVATHAACMSAQHFLKIVVFGLLGFAYSDWAVLIILIVSAGFAGTYIGTKFLRRMSDKDFKRGFNWLLTAIAVYLLAAAFADFKTN